MSKALSTKIIIEAGGSRFDWRSEMTLDEKQREVVLDLGSIIYDTINQAYGGIGRRIGTITVTVGDKSVRVYIGSETFEKKRFAGIDEIGFRVTRAIEFVHNADDEEVAA